MISQVEKPRTITAPVPEQPLLAEKMSRRVLELDGLRGIAILLVIVCHYWVNIVQTERGGPLAYLRGALGLTWSGVDLFFVLSGFLIGGILIDSRTSPNYYKTFVIRRVLRIFPVYYLSLALFAGVVLTGIGKSPALGWLFADPLPLASYATFTQNIVMGIRNTWGPNWINITWSLAVEEQFYMLLPLIVWLTPRHRLKYVLIVGILTAPAIRTILYFADMNVAYAGYALMPCRADALGIGALAAAALRSQYAGRFLPALKRGLYPAAFVLLIGLVALTLMKTTSSSLLLTSVGYTWIALFYVSLLLIAVLRPETWFSSLLRNSVLREIGLLAYFIYMFHQPLSGLFHGLLLGREPKIDSWLSGLVTVAAFAATFIAAKISWRYLEKPLINLGHTYKY
jgi:peptidoglycan/LPS O-acetylase OafA/YrhL